MWPHNDGNPCDLRWTGGANSKGQNADSSFPFPTLHVLSHLLTALWRETDCSYSAAFNLLTSCSITEALGATATVISVKRYQHQLISQKNCEQLRNGCWLLKTQAKCGVVFWRWKDLYAITDLLSFPVPGAYFHGKKNLFQITPDIFCTAQQLHLRMFSRCSCLYETYNNKVVNWRRQYPDCKKKGFRAAWKNMKIN